MIQTDARHIPLKDESVQCAVTSPPYWGLRDYGLEPSIWGGRENCEHEWGDVVPPRGQSGWDTFEHKYHSPGSHKTTLGSTMKEIEPNPGHGSFCQLCSAWRGVLGLEPTPELYVQHMVEVFREVKRVLRKDGTVWLNLGDSYATQRNDHEGGGFAESWGDRKVNSKPRPGTAPKKGWHGGDSLKPKDLCGIPWRVAFALQADGWWLRSDIIWSKPNPMPESVTDRPTKSHEYIFLLSKSADYYCDMEAIREPQTEATLERSKYPRGRSQNGGGSAESMAGWHRNDELGNMTHNPAGRNKRSVWTVATQPYPDAHFATFPEDLIKPCILAGAPAGGIVLDPFAGSGTTIKVAQDLGRIGVGLDLKPDYIKMARKRTAQQGLRY